MKMDSVSSSKRLPFKAGCRMLGLRKDDFPQKPDKSHRYVDKVKVVFAITTLAAISLVACLTILSITSEAFAARAAWHSSNRIYHQDAEEPSNSSDTQMVDSENSTASGNDSTLTASTGENAEALKLFVLTPRRGKNLQSIHVHPWRRYPTMYSDRFAQLEGYRNNRRIHSVHDMMRYIEADRGVTFNQHHMISSQASPPIQSSRPASAVKLAGVYVKGPPSVLREMDPSASHISNTYEYDPLRSFKPGDPSEINLLATSPASDDLEGTGQRFSTKLGLKNSYSYHPTHTEAIFHQYPGSGYVKENLRGSNTQSDSKKPISVMLDVFPVKGQTTEDRVNGKRGISTGDLDMAGSGSSLSYALPPPDYHFPSTSHHSNGGNFYRPPEEIDQIAEASSNLDRMVVHLNLYPGRKTKLRRRPSRNADGLETPILQERSFDLDDDEAIEDTNDSAIGDDYDQEEEEANDDAHEYQVDQDRDSDSEEATERDHQITHASTTTTTTTARPLQTARQSSSRYQSRRTDRYNMTAMETKVLSKDAVTVSDWNQGRKRTVTKKRNQNKENESTGDPGEIVRSIEYSFTLPEVVADSPEYKEKVYKLDDVDVKLPAEMMESGYLAGKVGDFGQANVHYSTKQRSTSRPIKRVITPTVPVKTSTTTTTTKPTTTTTTTTPRPVKKYTQSIYQNLELVPVKTTSKYANSEKEDYDKYRDDYQFETNYQSLATERPTTIAQYTTPTTKEPRTRTIIRTNPRLKSTTQRPTTAKSTSYDYPTTEYSHYYDPTTRKPIRRRFRTTTEQPKEVISRKQIKQTSRITKLGDLGTIEKVNTVQLTSYDESKAVEGSNYYDKGDYDFPTTPPSNSRGASFDDRNRMSFYEENNEIFTTPVPAVNENEESRYSTVPTVNLILARKRYQSSPTKNPSYPKTTGKPFGFNQPDGDRELIQVPVIRPQMYNNQLEQFLSYDRQKPVHHGEQEEVTTVPVPQSLIPVKEDLGYSTLEVVTTTMDPLILSSRKSILSGNLGELFRSVAYKSGGEQTVDENKQNSGKVFASTTRKYVDPINLIRSTLKPSPEVKEPQEMATFPRTINDFLPIQYKFSRDTENYRIVQDPIEFEPEEADTERPPTTTVNIVKQRAYRLQSQRKTEQSTEAIPKKIRRRPLINPNRTNRRSYLINDEYEEEYNDDESLIDTNDDSHEDIDDAYDEMDDSVTTEGAEMTDKFSPTESTHS